jgi:RimJ/RimL family protein N-acetyltransferase
VAVDERVRGRGFGKQLVSAGLTWIFDWPEINEVFLNTEPENVAALGLYERSGFQRKYAMTSFRKIV